MRALTVETDQPSSSPPQPNKLKAAATGASKWLTAQLARSSPSGLTRAQVAVICATIVVSALGVRLLHWQDKRVEIVGGKTSLSGVFNRYQKEARRILEEGGILFPRERPASGDARMLAHPPGYSILLAAIYRVGGDPYEGLWLVQIVCDAAAALLIFLIGLELLNWWVALTAAMLVTLSPHLAYYSLVLTPDSLAVPPILLAVYLMIKAWKRPSVIGMMLAGALIGVSCWLTANVMMLALFLGVVVLLLVERGRGLVLATALIGSTIMVVAPITVRNLAVFHRFIPLSIQAGLSLVEGIGDYDKDGKLGMPRSDREARLKDAEWNGRPDYAASLWNPDGIDRDRTRLEHGLASIRSNPGWFLGVMLRRAGFMLSYNDSSARQWPLSTASVPPVSAEAMYSHTLSFTDDRDPLQPEHPPVLVLNGAIIPGALAAGRDRAPAKSFAPVELNESGAALSPRAEVSLEPGGRTLQVVGDDSQYGDQFASAPITVRKNTDYVLELPVNLVRGDIALKVTSNDRRIALAVSDIAYAERETRSVEAKAPTGQTTAIQMPFATGNRTEVRIVLSNNSTGPTPPAALLGEARVFEIGPTTYVWTHYPRMVVRSIQREFTTMRVLTLIAIGIVLLLLSRRPRTLAILLVVPAYYLLIQSPLHTEYRYILAIHYFLFIMAATTIYYVSAAISQTARQVYHLATARSSLVAKGLQS